MSLANKAASGFLWTTLANVGSRVITIVSTFILTRFLAPEVQGDVNIAYVIVATGGVATTLGVQQYLASHPTSGRGVAFHGGVLLMSTGFMAMLLCVLLRQPLCSALNNPAAAVYVPGLALSHLIDRASWLPRNILVREMQFRLIGLRVALGEIVYAASSVSFASLGWGGNAIVGGNFARAIVALLFLIYVTERAEYLSPTRLSWATFKDLLTYGLPINVSNLLTVGAANWDNLFMSYRFGGATVGLYNQAYKLADLPATNVGEQINDVLVPTFARIEDREAKIRGLLRAAGLMALVVFPMAVGLGVIAQTAVEALYPPSYAGVAPFLAVMATLSAFRSLGVLAVGYLQVVGRTKVFILIDVVLVVVLLGAMAALSMFGAVWAAAGVGIAFTLNTYMLLRALRPDGIRVLTVLSAIVRPLLACVPLALAVLGVRAAMSGLGWHAAVRMLIELSVGAVAYVVAGLTIARPVAKDFIEIFLGVLRRKRGGPPPGPISDAA